MSFSTEIKGSFCGVNIPGWLRFFDCRWPDDKDFPKTPYGASLMGYEKAAFDIGLLSQNERNAVTPISCTTYVDHRTANHKLMQPIIINMIDSVIKLNDEFLLLKEKKLKAKNGGQAIYQPMFVALSNFGWTIVADRRNYVIRPFGYIIK